MLAIIITNDLRRLDTEWIKWDTYHLQGLGEKESTKRFQSI